MPPTLDVSEGPENSQAPCSARSPPASPSRAAQQRKGTTASTALRRRVLEHATLGEWEKVREAVDGQGCNVNMQDDQGFGLVHWAAHQGDNDAVKWLIERSAFLRLKDKKGETPMIAAKGECRELLLQEAYSSSERAFYRRRGAPTVAQLEQELGSAAAEALNEPLWDENAAPLCVALAARHGTDSFDAVPLLQWLLERGANLEAQDEDNNALLHHIDWSLGAAIVIPLLTWAVATAKVKHLDARNRDGDTPALLCASDSPSGADAQRCLEAFNEAGANLSLGSAKGVNVAMSLAQYQGEGPWLEWCYQKGGVDASCLCAKGRSVAEYLALYGREEEDDDEDDEDDE